MSFHKSLFQLGLLLAAAVAPCDAFAVPLSIEATVTGDNHYALYSGRPDTNVAFHGNGELTYVGNPGRYNWSLPETHNYSADSNDYLYVAGWSDDLVAQAWIGQFYISGGTGNPYLLTSNTVDWEVSYMAYNLGTGDSPPTAGEMLAFVQSAVWSSVNFSEPNGNPVWEGFIPGITQNASWIWGSSIIGDGDGIGEVQVFRTRLHDTQVPEPATMLLLGASLAGAAGVRRKKLAAQS